MMQNFEAENDYYRKCLKHPTIGQIGRNYLESRGINEETIEKWEIGWSPYNCTPTCYKSEKTKFWKKHYGRITFPIRDQSGKMLSISGRLVLKLNGVPKYDHYPFPARRILFGLYQNKEDIRKMNRAVVTEGQIDVITAWQAGFRIATSSFGAHGGLDHMALLSRYAQTVDILYDADKAGIEGEEAIKKLSTLSDLDVRFQKPFGKGQDLDSWITNHSADELWNLLDKTEVDVLKEKLLKLKGLK